MYIIDEKNRRVIISKTYSILPVDILSETYVLPNDAIIVKEHDKLIKKFIDGTIDKYECELILKEVEIRNELNPEIKTGKYETKAFAKRIGYDNWLMEFDENEYILK